MKALLTVLALGCVFGIFFCISLLEKLFGGATLHGLYARMLCRLRRYNDWRTTLFVPLLRLGRKLAFLEEHWNFRTVLLGPVFPDPMPFQVAMPQKREPLAILSSEKSFLSKTQEALKNLGSLPEI